MPISQKFVSSKTFQFLIGRRRFSLLMGWLADLKAPKFVLNYVIQKYSNAFAIQLNDYILDDGSITSFNAFFTRKFKNGMRYFSDGVASPVEGAISAFGKIENGTLYQIKGKSYALSDLVLTDNAAMQSYITIYLSPADYHRIHFPFDATVDSVRHISGDRFSVSMEAVNTVEQLFCKNERAIISGQCEYGRFHIILVGAIIVGKITVTPVPEFKPGYSNVDLHIEVKKGDELGKFLLGSTIVLILEKDFSSNMHFAADQKIKLGDKLF